MAVKGLQSVERALRVVEAVGEHQPIGLAALARELGESKSALQRVLVTLRDAGWIWTLGDGAAPQWELAPRLAVLGEQAMPGDRLQERARPVMTRLRDELAESVLLSVLDGDQVVIVGSLDGPQGLRVHAPVGTRASRRDSAAGRAIDLMNDPATAADGASLPYAVAEETAQAGFNAVAAGIPVEHGRVVAALVVAGPASRLTGTSLTEAGRVVAAAAGELGELTAVGTGAAGGTD